MTFSLKRFFSASIKKRIHYQVLAPNIIQVPGENPNSATLNGTNCYVLGSSFQRLMIDAGDLPPINEHFIENLKICMQE